ncbi:septum site-determining protein MinC [Butyrivibrio sp. X503]|uniref:septum site-determining protein MinC n=1 Tax=Butyrivibrio sp. X503 TaxID=2364878 RepID=UPI000EA863CE|nr:septum site-determining protein MinC [Butyrivibrio sp. X503]RKM57220.1 septum site-determining protein MinC [Butyrivibrio sp. X503]
MNQLVTIKGTKSGIILVLDNAAPFPVLSDEVASRFKEAASFLGNKNMGLIIRGRKLSDDEESKIVKIIEDNCELKIFCVIDEESGLEKIFEHIPSSDSNLQSDNSADIEAIQDNDGSNNALILKGNLRSGQDVSCKQSVVILGDVKPGANVISYGSIFILGELRGNAFAGAGGDRSAIVMALNLNPLQVRIADAIAISPDAEKGPKLKFKKKKLMGNDNGGEPEVAYIEGDHIVKTAYGASFLRQLNN